jgi:uncharacterized cupin superfamily protein
MSSSTPPMATDAAAVPPRVMRTIYLEPFAERVAGREKRQLGDLFGLKNFGEGRLQLSVVIEGKKRFAHKDGTPY